MQHVIDVTDQTFYDEVLVKSNEVPVVVDLWAEWCGPCKTLGPVLEGLAEEYGGGFILAKVDVDANQQIAMQMRVQSIPTVVAFKDGQPIDAFQGALPKEQVKQWLAKFAQPQDSEPEPEPLTGPAKDLAEGNWDAAAGAFQAMLADDETNPEGLVGLCRVALGKGDPEGAKAIWDKVPEERLVQIEGEWEDVWLKMEVVGAPDVAELDERVEANGNDHEARYQRALLAANAGDWDSAMLDLLQIVVRDREWRDDGARIAMVNLFRVLGENSPLTAKWRVEMGRAMYV